MNPLATMDVESQLNWAWIQNHLQFHLSRRAHSLVEGSGHEALFHSNCFIVQAVTDADARDVDAIASDVDSA